MSAAPIFVDTNLDTHFAMDISVDDTIADVKRKVMVEHLLCFPDVGEITISAAKVRRKSCFYHLSDSMCIRSAFCGIKGTWHIHIDAASTCLMKSQATSKENLLGSENGRLEVPHPLELRSRNILADVSRHAENDVLNRCPSAERVRPDSGTTLLDHCDKSTLHCHFNQKAPVPDDLQQHEIESSHTQNQKVRTISQLTSVDPNREASRSPGAQDLQLELGVSTSNVGNRPDLGLLKTHNRDNERSGALECHLSSHDNVRDKDPGTGTEDLPSASVSPNKGDRTKKRDLEIDSNLAENLQVAVVQKRWKREKEMEDSLPPEKDIFDDSTAISCTKEISEVKNPNSKELSSKTLNNNYPSSEDHVERRKKKSSKQKDRVDSETTGKTGLSTMPLTPLGGPGGVIASEKTIPGVIVPSTDATVVIHQATESHDRLKSDAPQDVGTWTSKTPVAARDLDNISMNVMESKVDASGNEVTFEEKKVKKSQRHRANSSKSSNVVSAEEDGNVKGGTIPLEMLVEAVVRDTHNVTALPHNNLTTADENANKPVATDASGSLMASAPNEIAGSKVVAEMDVSMPLVAPADKKTKPNQHFGVSSRGVNPLSVEEHGNIVKDATTSSYIDNDGVRIHELDETRKEINIPSKSKELKATDSGTDYSKYELGLEEAEKRKDGIDSSKLTDVSKVTEFEEAKDRRGKKSKKTRGSSTRSYADDNTIVASAKKFNTKHHSYATKEATIALQAEKVKNQQTENSNSQLPFLEEGADGDDNSVNTTTAFGVESTNFRVEKGRNKLKRALTSMDASEPLTNQLDKKSVHLATSVQEHEETGEVQNQNIEKEHVEASEVQNQNMEKEHEETGEVQNQKIENMKQEKALPRKKKKAKSGKIDHKDPVSGSMMEGENDVGIETVGSVQILTDILEGNVEGKHQKSNGRGKVSVINSSMNEANNGKDQHDNKAVHLATSVQEEHEETGELRNQSLENMKQEKALHRKKKKVKSGKTDSKDPLSGSMMEGDNNVGIETAGSEQILPNTVECNVEGKHQKSNGRGEISVINSSMSEANNGKAAYIATSILEEHDATAEVLNQNMENVKQEKASPRKKKKGKSGKTNSKDTVSGSMMEKENDVGIRTVRSEQILPKILDHDVGGKHQNSNGIGEIFVIDSSMNEANDGSIDFKKFFVPQEKKQQLAVDPAANLSPGEAAKKSLKERPNKVARKPDVHSEDSFCLGVPSNSLDPSKHGIKVHEDNEGNIEIEAPLSRNDEDKIAAPPKRKKSSRAKVDNASGNSGLADVAVGGSKENGTPQATSSHHPDQGNKIRMEPPIIQFGGFDGSKNRHVSSPSNHNRYRVAVRKVPSRKFGEVFNVPDLEKNSLATDSIFKHLNSESSPDEGEVNDSDATTINHSTDSSSTSAYSDEEQGRTHSKSLTQKNQSNMDSPLEGPGVSSVLGGKNKEDDFTDANLSQSKATKNRSISKVLRSSSAYKKAKVTLSQSRLDDFESQPDIVPDSQALD